MDDAQNGASAHALSEHLYLNRELAWLAFNQRVLDQAANPDWPLLERVKFLAIFGSNLDEFFMIRVSGLHEQLESGVIERTPDGLSASEQLARIGATVRELVARAARLLADELLPALASQGIRIRTWASLSHRERDEVRAHFRKAVFPILTPLAVDPVHPFPFVSNLSLSLAVEVIDPSTLARRFARVKVPESLPRFVALGRGAADNLAMSSSSGHPIDLLPLEDLIAHNLGDLFPGMEIAGWFPFRVTRDMDLEILEQEADDLLSIVAREIRRRRFGAAVRLEVGLKVPEHIRDLLLAKLEIEEEDLYAYSGLLGFAGLFALTQLARPDLRDPPMSGRPASEIVGSGDPFAAIRAGDILLHHPYDSFSPVLELLQRAADDPDVLAIKMTLYRAGSNAEVVRALTRAAENGKQVAVSIELKARFDEERNVQWARWMDRAGVHVFYGSTGVKTHAKVLLIIRREEHELRRYVHLSTGNYNAATAKLYTDLGLFSADAAIGEDASELFNALSGFAWGATYRRLAVAPVDLRETLLAKIHDQAERAKAGKGGRIFAKLNAIVDTSVIAALYRASQAGVSIDLVVRGICCLRPGIAGISENIRVHSIIGRFLEHERVFVFGEGADEEFYLSSADWMPRNLDRRVEVLVPICSEAARERIRQECILPLQLDNCRVYAMQSDGTYCRRRPADGQTAVDAQVVAASPPRPSAGDAPASLHTVRPIVSATARPAS
jgi:polyphosphate kinase